MRHEDKKALYAFVTEHFDGSEKAVEAKKILETELNYADCESHSISIDDLNSLGGEDQKTLREKLSKMEDEEWTIDDCVRVADALADFIGDDFSEDLYNALRYCL